VRKRLDGKSGRDRTWPAVYAAVVATRPDWDAWGIDDGRPPAALDAVRYDATPIPAHRAVLGRALDGARDAWLATIQAEGARVAAGREPGPERAAGDVAFAILSLGWALLDAGTVDGATALRNAATHARLAPTHGGWSARPPPSPGATL